MGTRRALLAILVGASPSLAAAQCELRKTVASRAQLEELVSDVRAMSSPALAEALELMAGSEEVEVEWCWPERPEAPSKAAASAEAALPSFSLWGPEPAAEPAPAERASAPARLPSSLADEMYEDPEDPVSEILPGAVETAPPDAPKAKVGSVLERDGVIQLWIGERPPTEYEARSVCVPLERIPWDPGQDPELVQPPDALGDRLRWAADPRLLDWADSSVSCMERGIADWLARQGYDPTNPNELERFERDRRLEEEVFTDPKGKRVYKVTLLDLKF